MGNSRNGVKTRFPARRGGKRKRQKTSLPGFFADSFSPPSAHRPVIGVALSCGGAKGLAHLGVIRVLRENGIEPDIIAGSSMGAYVGALWAKGYDPDEMEKMAMECSGLCGALKLADPKLWPIRGLLRGKIIEDGLRRRLKYAKFKELRIPLVISGTDLDNLETHWFDQGDVASAVRASCGLPGIFAPKKIRGKNYVDGGIAAPLPVEKLRQMGADIVIHPMSWFHPKRETSSINAPKPCVDDLPKNIPSSTSSTKPSIPFPLAVDSRYWTVVYRLGRHAGSLSA